MKITPLAPSSCLLAAGLLLATGCDHSVSSKKLSAEKPAAPSVAPSPVITPPPAPQASTMKKHDFTVPPDAELKQKLTPLQWKVTKEEGTERAFQNEYWNNHEDGLYVCVVSGKPLFSSRDKFDSGTGWPSFTKPLEGGEIVTKEDRSFFSVRTEVRAKTADTHLGHVFDDGPAPTGLRYCMNSAALKFIPKDKLVEEGYGDWLKEFDEKK